MTDDKRLIEDYLPIGAITRENTTSKGHINTLHLWWARRPLLACRAAVYGALVPASQFVPNGASDAKKKSLGRANAAKFITSLCQYPGSPHFIKEAQHHILKAHADRLTQETGKPVTVEDIVDGRAPRPRVLDMFAGGGAIPLEALRLGCDAYANDLNPVAHIIQLCTLVYPQKYGKPDPTARGMTGPKNQKGETTWGGLADEVRYWGNWVLEKVRAEIGDLYPPIARTFYSSLRQGRLSKPQELVKAAALAKVPKDSHPLVRNALALLRSNYWDGHEVVSLEEPFFMDLASRLPPVIGIPDLVLRRDGSFLVVDHKTSKAFKDLDSSQLVLYAEHIRRQYSTNSIIGVFDEYRLVADLSSIRKPAFRRTPVSVDRSFLPALIAKYRKAWREILSIQNHGEPSASSDCWICNQNAYSSYY